MVNRFSIFFHIVLCFVTGEGASHPCLTGEFPIVSLLVDFFMERTTVKWALLKWPKIGGPQETPTRNLRNTH